MSSIPFCVCIGIYKVFFIHSSVDGHLDYFHVLGIMGCAAVNRGVHESFQGIVFFFLGICSGLEMLDHMETLFLFFLRNFHTVFHSGCNRLHSPNSVRGFPSSPHALQHLLFITCLMMALLIGMRWYLNSVSVGLSLLMSNAEHLFICLLAMCVSSFKPQISIVRVISTDFV